MTTPPFLMSLSTRRVRACMQLGLALVCLPNLILAVGTIVGFVHDAKLDNALSNARAVLDISGRQAVTGEDGTFVFPDVPAGSVKVHISYLGMQPQIITVDVADGRVTYRDIPMSRIEVSAGPSEVIKLEKFTVVADREESARDMAINDQLMSPNAKNVVALDEYGNRKGSIGQFLSFLPGVSIDYSGNNPMGASLRGFPPELTDISIDGAPMSTSQAEQRGQRLDEVSSLNISRVEVTKVPTPDRPASGLGGSINLISRSPFESKRRKFTYDIYGMYHSWQGLTLDGGPKGNLSYTTHQYNQPSVELTFLEPITNNLALTLGYSRYWEHKPGESGNKATDERPNWNIVDMFQRQSRWYSLNQVKVRTAAQIGLDWRMSPRDSISVRYWYQNPLLITDRLVFDVNYGAGAVGGPTYTQGSTTGVGTININKGSDKYTTTENNTTTIRYNHFGDVWKVASRFSYTDSSTEKLDFNRGFFNTTTTRITQAIIRGENIPASGGSIPTTYLAKTRTGQPIDIYDGGNYSIDRITSQQNFTNMERVSADLSFRRDFMLDFPLSIQLGSALDSSKRKNRVPYLAWNFRPNGKSDVASRRAGNFDLFDEEYLREAPTIFDNKVRWISGRKIFDLFETHPDWFVLDEVASHRTSVTNARQMEETISAGYLRTDFRLFNNRLWIVAGARYERTDISGRGPLIDPGAVYQRDAMGNYVLSNGNKVLITTDPLERAKLEYKELGASAKRSYDGVYPSINSTYAFTDSLLLRFGFAQTIGRPQIGTIIPGVTVSLPDAANPTIVVSNTGLKPWEATSFDVSLESYQIKGGIGSIGVFHKSIRDFFGRLQTPATPELLSLYGLSDEMAYDGYTISTMTNVGDARVRGLELSYRQSLYFLPYWARGLQVFANITRIDVDGSNLADFTGFSPKNVAMGISLIRPMYSIKLTYNFRDATRSGLEAPNAANGIPENTVMFEPVIERYGLDMQYNISKRLGLYLTMTDLRGFKQDSKRYAPDTPAYARTYFRQELGYFTTIGVRGEF